MDNKRGTILWFVIIGLTLLGGSGVFFWTGMSRDLYAMNYEKTNCTVISYDIINKTCFDGSGYFNQTGYVTFKYEVDNLLYFYKCSAECKLCNNSTKVLFHDLTIILPLGSDVPCYYNKKNPNQVTLLKNTNRGIVFYIIGGIFVGVGLFSIVLAILSCCQERNKKFQLIPNSDW